MQVFPPARFAREQRWQRCFIGRTLKNHGLPSVGLSCAFVSRSCSENKAAPLEEINHTQYATTPLLTREARRRENLHRFIGRTLIIPTLPCGVLSVGSAVW